ncbi:hypothetical protein AAHE18_09G171500 [Arachis hypogaea]|nr:uncharacterized protein DS421_9g277990 [Arachis hypogaea]
MHRSTNYYFPILDLNFTLALAPLLANISVGNTTLNPHSKGNNANRRTNTKKKTSKIQHIPTLSPSSTIQFGVLKSSTIHNFCIMIEVVNHFVTKDYIKDTQLSKATIQYTMYRFLIEVNVYAKPLMRFLLNTR